MNISILGSRITQFGELWDKSLQDLLIEAMDEAVNNSGLEPKEIEAIYVANKAGGGFVNQRHLNALASGHFAHLPPAFRIEAACASGGLALVSAEQALLSGQFKTVLVVGVEKMTDVSSSQTTQLLATAADMAQEYGSTFPALYALLANIHMQKFGTTRKQLSAVAVKNHGHAMSNPQAQYHKEFSLDQVSNSLLVADPLRLLDCSPITDGAAAVVLTSQDPLNQLEDSGKNKPQILGVGHAQDSLSLAGRKSLTELSATQKAAKQAFRQAKLSPQDIKVAEVHDCFTIAELLAIEDLGFVEKGQGGPATLAGKTSGKKLTINHSGGLKACGHPVGATGVKQVAYLAQLIENDVYDQALAHNVGGSGATAVVHILGGKK